MEWTEIKKQKTKENQYVIVYALGGRTLASLYKNGKFFCYDVKLEDLEAIEEPTHWMPLPEPPTTEVNN